MTYKSPNPINECPWGQRGTRAEVFYDNASSPRYKEVLEILHAHKIAFRSVLFDGNLKTVNLFKKKLKGVAHDLACAMPHIFLDGKSIGGLPELKKMDKDDTLR